MWNWKTYLSDFCNKEVNNYALKKIKHHTIPEEDGKELIKIIGKVLSNKIKITYLYIKQLGEYKSQEL